jgi:hypothetical protein
LSFTTKLIFPCFTSAKVSDSLDMASSGIGHYGSTSSSSGSEMHVAGQQKRNETESSDEDGEGGGQMEVQGQFLPGRPGRHEVFFEDVSEVGVEKKYRKVHCLLCGDGKLLSLGSFHKHIKSMHEPPVKCEGCGKEVSAGEQLRRHIKQCRSKNTKIARSRNQT